MPRWPSTITIAARGALRLKQTLSTLPPKFAGSNLSSEILITADGRFLYVSNRLHNALAVFAVAADGQLRLTSETWVHADYPRSVAIDPSGDIYFLVQSEGRFHHLVSHQLAAAARCSSRAASSRWEVPPS